MGEGNLVEVSEKFIEKYRVLNTAEKNALIVLVDIIKKHGAFELENYYVGQHGDFGRLLLNLSDKQITILFEGINQIVLWDIVY